MTPNEERDVIKKIAILNAIQYGGKSKLQPVLGKLLTEKPQLKTRINEVMPIVREVVEEINLLSLEKQKQIVEEEIGTTFKERVQVVRKLPPLPNVEKYKRVVTRFAPNPDCVLHLGSARAIVLSDEYAKIHKGSFRLRFEDTDPRLKRAAKPFYESICEDLKWLGCKWDMAIIQSTRLPIYYEYAEMLLKNGGAYVCTCPSEKFRKMISAKKACPCRRLASAEQIKRWKLMLDGTYMQGKAIVRVKTDLEHLNPAVRDWPAFRIINPEKYPHPLVGGKYRVWPLYNFSAGIDDHLMDVTHIIRGKEHLTNQTRQEYMYRHFGWKYPEAIHYGRMKITGGVLSKSKIVEGVRTGAFMGWDDPRLATFVALRKRGMMPETIRRLIIEVGPKTVDAVLSWDNLYAINRKFIDPVANRYFFVRDPRKIIVKCIQRAITIKKLLHPEHPERGNRIFKIKPKNSEATFWISCQDANLLKEGSVVRLMEFINIQIQNVRKGVIEAFFHSKLHEEGKKLGAPLIQWIPTGTGIPCEVIMPDATIARGVAEDSCKQLKPNEIIQFERFGFVRVEKINWTLLTHFAHR